MSRSILASLMLFGFVATGVRAEDAAHDRNVWRWTASKALEAQKAADPSRGDVYSQQYVQRHERYSFGGQPEAAP